MKGKTYALGCTHTKEANVQKSTRQKGKRHWNYNGGKELAEKRHRAKRRNLGFMLLNTYFEGCEGHHITHNYVVYIPAYLHKSVWHNLNTEQGMEAINILALEFLGNGF